MYTSWPIDLSQDDVSSVITSEFTGITRIAALPDSDPGSEAVLDRFSSVYPFSGILVMLFLAGHSLWNTNGRRRGRGIY